jgi:hypothetical protein
VKQIHIIAGGTVFHIKPHLALCAPAYGQVSHDLVSVLEGCPDFEGEVHVYLTKMAGDEYLAFNIDGRTGRMHDLDPNNEEPMTKNIETNADVSRLLDELIETAKPNSIIFMPVAMCDFEVESLTGIGGWGDAVDTTIGKHADRLKTGQTYHNNGLSWPQKYDLRIKDAEKIIGNIREERKDLFVVGFKTTTGATPEQQFEAGLKLLKTSSINLVLANDTRTRMNLIVTPEQAAYRPTKDREQALDMLIQMALSRSEGHFTRSVVAEGKAIKWQSDTVPATLRTVVDHCVKRGAYKPFLGATVGHFAFKVENNKFVTSRRKTNFNNLNEVGMVLVETLDDDRVIAYGGKPSVGGQSQRIIFADHPEMDCIVHFHCPMKPGARIPVREQWLHECGSHECGKNTSNGLKEFELGRYNHNVSKLVGRGHPVKAVMLDKHGPNIVFNREANPQDIINFIEENWDLSRSTSELSTEQKQGMIDRTLEKFIEDPFEDGR